MDNYAFIRQASREELNKIINLLINEGALLVSEELWEATHVKDQGDNFEEVENWLQLDTLERRKIKDKI